LHLHVDDCFNVFIRLLVWEMNFLFCLFYLIFFTYDPCNIAYTCWLMHIVRLLHKISDFSIQFTCYSRLFIVMTNKMFCSSIPSLCKVYPYLLSLDRCLLFNFDMFHTNSNTHNAKLLRCCL
jgi:hypothetical protein